MKQYFEKAILYICFIGILVTNIWLFVLILLKGGFSDTIDNVIIFISNIIIVITSCRLMYNFGKGTQLQSRLVYRGLAVMFMLSLLMWLIGVYEPPVIVVVILCIPAFLAVIGSVPLLIKALKDRFPLK